VRTPTKGDGGANTHISVFDAASLRRIKTPVTHRAGMESKESDLKPDTGVPRSGVPRNRQPLGPCLGSYGGPTRGGGGFL